MKSTLVTGGLMLAMLGVTVALSAAADTPPSPDDLTSVANAVDSDDSHIDAVCVNCRARISVPVERDS